jgi:hypothetical protein
MNKRLVKLASVGAAASLTVLGWGASTSASAVTSGSGGLQYLGSVNVRSLPGPSYAGPTRPFPGQGDHAGPAAGVVPAPNPPNLPLSTAHPGASGFSGLNAATSGRLNGFDVEPPDQGLCAFHGVVMEQVNLAVQVFTDHGAALTRPVSLNAFFGQAPFYNPATKRFGPFLSDPRCYYDWQTGRWFSTVLTISLNPKTGNFGNRSTELIAVSKTSDPTGDYAIFAIPSEFNNLAHCPCFGDQPRLGADANGFYVSADIYPIHGLFNSHGGALWAVSKRGLEAAANGGPLPTLVTIHTGAIMIGGFPSNALQPASTPPGGGYAPNTEYFLNTPDFNGFATSGGHGARAIVLWALTGTNTLNSAHPTVQLNDAIVPSEPFSPPVPADQKAGPRPLGMSLHQPVPKLNPDDDRMQNVTYTDGRVVGELDTGVGPNGVANRDAAAWFVVSPSLTPSGVTGAVVHQGYVAIAEGNVLYPSIGLNEDGVGALAFSISGEDFFPSAAYAPFTLTGPTDAVHLSGLGVAPEDGFTCYPPYTKGLCRWGDYSYAVSEDGAIVMGAEYIPGPRDQFANWGTFITRYGIS